MKETLDRLKKVVSDCAVTLVLRTHRTHPENAQDSIKLKNKVSEARVRLAKEYDAATAKNLGEKLEKLAEEIDVNYNLEGLVLFVDADHAEFVRLPVELNDRIIIDSTFATRPLFRALNLETRYYLLMLSKDKARLLRASSSNLEEEIGGDFPAVNTASPKSRTEGNIDERQSKLQLEFFNNVDKFVNKVHQKEPLPIYIASDDMNYGQYLKVADRPNTIYGEVALKNRDGKAGNSIKEVWPAIQEETKARNLSRKEELKKAIGSGKVVSDYSEIWQALEVGRGATLFVQEGLFQPAQVKDNHIKLIDKADINSKDDVDDIIDEMIEKNSLTGGDVVFLPKEEMADFQGLALVTRY